MVKVGEPERKKGLPAGLKDIDEKILDKYLVAKMCPRLN